jgi:von Willebrand factor type A domain
MQYSQPASTLTPALVMYVIDISDSMNEPCGQTTKIDMVNSAIKITIKDLARRSMRDGAIQCRYKVAIIAYNNETKDILGGIRDLPDIIQDDLPELQASGTSDMTAGLTAAESLLLANLDAFQQSPAPLICHLTDGLYTAKDPTPIVQRLRAISVPDGAVLVENIFVADGMLKQIVRDWHQWRGVIKAIDLADKNAQFLFNLSSPLPEPYRKNINQYGYQLQPGISMFFPGSQSDLIRLGFAASIATQVK